MRLAARMDGRWFVRSVNRLTRFGHSLESIRQFTLDQFMWHLDATEQVEARERLQTIADLQVVVGSVFGEGEGLEEHTADLRLAARGA